MAPDELAGTREVVGLGREIQVGPLGPLVAAAETGPGFPRIRVVVPDRHFDQPGVQHRMGGVVHFDFDLPHGRFQFRRVEYVGVETDQQRRVGRADFGHAGERAGAEPGGHRIGLEVRGQAHRLRDFDEKELVAAPGVPRRAFE